MGALIAAAFCAIVAISSKQGTTHAANQPLSLKSFLSIFALLPLLFIYGELACQQARFHHN